MKKPETENIKLETIHLATDHAGHELKESLKPWLEEQVFEVVDHGAHQFDPEDDYPQYIAIAAEKISKFPDQRAIIFGGSGQGEAIVANRYPSVRAVVYYGGNLEIIKLSREHNNANMLSLGARFLEEDEAKEAVQLWLDTDFSEEERHVRRIAAIDQKTS